MKPDENTAKRAKLHYAEDFGLAFEKEGLPRMAGRIFGWMLVAESPHQSLQELAEVLRASKGSISNMTRYLMQLDAIERVALPGQRRDYVEIKAGAWLFMPSQWSETITSIRELAERGLELLEGKTSESRERLEEIRDLYAFLEEEFPSLLERWERKRKASAR
jgi:DNA-binding transcriptional regulator GbsR (MarR family)